MDIEKQNFPEFCYNLQIKKMEIFMEDAGEMMYNFYIFQTYIHAI